jgi:hypothetical protein
MSGHYAFRMIFILSLIDEEAARAQPDSQYDGLFWFLITVKKLVPFTSSQLRFSGSLEIEIFFRGVFMISLVLLGGVRYFKC